MRQGTIIAVNTHITTKELIGVIIKGTNGKVMSVVKSQLIGAIQQQPDAIDNCKLDEHGNLKFTNGAMERYTDLCNCTESTIPLVILNKIQYNGITLYEISDFEGKTILEEENMAAMILRERGLANGKLIEKNGRIVISAIQGEYPTRQLEISEKDEITRVYRGKEIGTKLKSTNNVHEIVGPAKQVIEKAITAEIYKGHGTDTFAIPDELSKNCNKQYLHHMKEKLDQLGIKSIIQTFEVQPLSGLTIELEMIQYSTVQDGKSIRVLEGLYLIAMERLMPPLNGYTAEVYLDDTEDKVIETGRWGNWHDEKVSKNKTMDHILEMAKASIQRNLSWAL